MREITQFSRITPIPMQKIVPATDPPHTPPKGEVTSSDPPAISHSRFERISPGEMNGAEVRRTTLDRTF